MKIAILTHPLDYNYGCLLQAFALQKTIKSMGHDVITINRFSTPYQPFHILIRGWLSRLLRRLLRGQKVSLVWNPTESMKTKLILSAETQKFVDRNIRNYGPVFPKDLESIDQKFKFDAYVVGSDQVWLPHFSSNCFLDFVHRDNVIRVFYAASSGSRCFADDPNILKKCKDLVKSFSGISVREDNLIPVVKEYLGRDAIQVLDPTMLLDANEYIDACVEKVETSPIVFTYILDKTEDKQNLVNKVKKDLNLPVINGTVDKDYVKGKGMDINQCIYPSVDKWILNLARAKFVVTDSFHGTCMSIIFRKPFVVVGNASRGLNRFLSVLNLFGLENRLITNSSDFHSDFYLPLPIDSLESKINDMRKISFSYLQTYLS